VHARSRSLAEIHLAVVLFGFPGLFGKWLAMPPALIVFGRVLFASLTLAAVLALGRRAFRVSPRRDIVLLVACGFILAVLFLIPAVVRGGLPYSGRDWALLAVLGVFCTAAAHTLFIEGMKGVGARTASVLSSLEPVCGILLAVVFLKENPSLRTVSGGVIVLSAAAAATVRARRAS
jgi:drug/metabolite transporter (DMT)-like permease